MILPLVLCAAVAFGRPLDEVVLENGTRLEGRVLLEDETRLVIRIGSRDRTVDRSDVREARTRLSAWREAMERWDALEDDDAVRIADIAAFCRRAGLSEEARVFGLYALTVDPESVLAHESAGHERRGKEWFQREGSRRRPWNRPAGQPIDWRDAWVLETTHWSLRSNLPLAEALRAILDLENAYRAWYGLFAAELEFLHRPEPMRAQIHADAASFPESSGSAGFYDRDARTLFVNASKGLDAGLMVHEAVHMLLDATSAWDRGARGSIPAWLDEGLAEYVRATLTGRRGRLAYDPSGINVLSMRAHAHAKRPYDLSRVLNFGPGDFAASSRQDLKYAQAYTFVHFLIEAENGRWREPFFEFLRSAWRGQGSSTDLEKVLGAKAEAIEKAWIPWVEQRAR